MKFSFCEFLLPSGQGISDSGNFSLRGYSHSGNFHSGISSSEDFSFREILTGGKFYSIGSGNSHALYEFIIHEIDLLAYEFLLHVIYHSWNLLFRNSLSDSLSQEFIEG